MRKRSSRAAPRNAAAGQIVEVHGGRIVRSTGGKDRHSKVCTAKGTRDRRVRLAAHTAIQFYDVQDRLGFDRPSRAVDWLINKAKAAIDELDELPPWNPATAFLNCNSGKSKTLGGGDEAADDGGGGDEMYGSSCLLPPSMDSDAAIADSIKSSTPLDVQFQSYPAADLLHRRSSSQSQDLKLSLQSLQDPILIQSHHHSRGQNQVEEEEEDPRLFSESTQIGFDNQPASWAENQRLIGWNSAGGFMFIPPQASEQQLLFGHGVGSSGVGQTATHFFPQREPLQSSNSPSNGAQIGDVNNQNYHQAIPSLSGIGFTSSGGFSGFPFTAHFRGDQEDHDGGDPNKTSSMSSSSRH